MGEHREPDLPARVVEPVAKVVEHKHQRHHRICHARVNIHGAHGDWARSHHDVGGLFYLI